MLIPVTERVAASVDTPEEAGQAELRSSGTVTWTMVQPDETWTGDTNPVPLGRYFLTTRVRGRGSNETETPTLPVTATMLRHVT